MAWTIPQSALQVSKWLLSFCHKNCLHGNILIDLIWNCEMTVLITPSASQEPRSPFGDTYRAATMAICKCQQLLKMWKWITETVLSMNCYLKNCCCFFIWMLWEFFSHKYIWNDDNLENWMHFLFCLFAIFILYLYI